MQSRDQCDALDSLRFRVLPALQERQGYAEQMCIRDRPWTFHVWRDTGGNENSNIFIKPLDAGHGWLAPWTLFETSWEAA